MLRTMRLADLPRVMEIWLVGNLSAHDFIPAAYWQDNMAAVAEAIAAAEVWVYAEDNRPLGFISLCDDYIAGLFVEEACRSRGIGRQLLNAAKARHNRLTLNVYAKNHRACAFYRREGFCQTAAQTDPATNETEYQLYWQK